jgi:hypothetical protein
MFVQKLKDIQLQETDILVSSDVASLFTSVLGGYDPNSITALPEKDHGPHLIRSHNQIFCT